MFPPQQTKRKLDDANKRLEALYDKLREQTVSAPRLRLKGQHAESKVCASLPWLQLLCGPACKIYIFQCKKNERLEGRTFYGGVKLSTVLSLGCLSTKKCCYWFNVIGKHLQIQVQSMKRVGSKFHFAFICETFFWLVLFLF